jgi:excisionase family DNA binding protein
VAKTKAATDSLWEQLFDPASLYTVDEVAEKVRGSGRMVRRWLAEGRVPFVELPKGRRIQGQAMIDFLAERFVDPSDRG